MLDTLDAAKITASVKAALALHPTLTRYTVAVPFDLTGPTRRRGTSTSERWDDLVREWTALAKGMKHAPVRFEIWPQFELVRRLIAQDRHGGIRAYWFDADHFDIDWFGQQISQATRDAGPRYNPGLTIAVPLAATIEEFGETSTWREDSEKHLKALDKRFTHLAARIRDRQKNADPLADLLARMSAACAQLRPVLEATWFASADGRPARAALTEAIALTREARDEFRAELVAQHGPGAPDDASFRQFHAEYMVTFPAEDYDLTREILTRLETIGDGLYTPIANAREQRALLITGIAGAGKTHSVCDAATQRIERGLLSVVVLCEKSRARRAHRGARRVGRCAFACPSAGDGRSWSGASGSRCRAGIAWDCNSTERRSAPGEHEHGRAR